MLSLPDKDRYSTFLFNKMRIAANYMASKENVKNVYVPQNSLFNFLHST